MQEITLTTRLQVYENMSELPDDALKLMNAAIVARTNAYAPYSKFNVGAALLLDNGEVISGNNQENAAYPSGLCAERVAIFYAGSQYPNAKVLQMAITATSINHVVTTPTPPCGACRQSIAEYEFKQESPIQLFFMGESGKVLKSNSLKDLLPLVFDRSFL
jgi:cytidine deaminase